MIHQGNIFGFLSQICDKGSWLRHLEFIEDVAFSLLRENRQEPERAMPDVNKRVENRQPLFFSPASHPDFSCRVRWLFTGAPRR